MERREWDQEIGLKVFVVGLELKQVSRRARIMCRGTSGILSWSLMILSSQPAASRKLCMLELCKILASEV